MGLLRVGGWWAARGLIFVVVRHVIEMEAEMLACSG